MKRYSQHMLLAAALLLLGIAGSQELRLRASRHTIIPHLRLTVHKAPPALAFSTIVLGGFRGLIADVLWLRASILQEEGKYFEMVQLADWITKLEPHFTEVWAYHAWNMAYNVSVMLPRPEDRWRWVKNGIALLRDEGIIYHPDDPRLYFELGWLFQHKIGGNTDTKHLYYKQQWFNEMEKLLPGGRLENATASKEIQTRMQEEYGLNPGVMQQIDSEYGPIDWRLPMAHSLYWGVCGRMVAGTNLDLTCERMIYQSLADLTLHGISSSNAPGENIILTPNFAIIPKAIQAYESLSKKVQDPNVRISYFFFLKDVALAWKDAGKDKESRAVFKEIQEHFPPDPSTIDYETFLVHYAKQKK